MPPDGIIDSHVHLWPEHMANEDGHAWMTPGMPLAKQLLLSNYYGLSENKNGNNQDCIEGIVYVETDVRYEKPSGDLATWAKGPLDEIKFLRAIVEGEYGERDSQKLLGIVAWAPMDQSSDVLEQWLGLAEQTAGPQTWKRLKGFRFLLQAILDKDDFENLVFSAHFQQNLKMLGRRGFSFDIGVDQNSGGVWQLEAISKAMKMAHEDVLEEERVTFIVNHFCKPDFASRGEPLDRWRAAIKAMSTLSQTYVKLSGAFSELPAGLQGATEVASHMRPWYRHVFQIFGPHRIMFGSDWPVCNLKGPRGDSSRVAWQEVADLIVQDLKDHMSTSDEEWIWRNTAVEAYRLKRE